MKGSGRVVVIDGGQRRHKALRSETLVLDQK